VASPEGETVRLGLEVKVSANAQMVFDQLARLRDGRPDVIPLLFVWRITRRVAEVCREAGICFLDAFGSAMLRWCGLYIERSPLAHPLIPPKGQLRLWVESRLPGLPDDVGELLSMRAPLRQRVARVLLSNPGALWAVGDLARAAGVSLPTASKVVKVLEEQVMVRREQNGMVKVSAPGALLREWSGAWKLGARGRRGYYCPGRNVEDVTAKLSGAAEVVGARLGLTLAAGASYYGSYLRDDLVHAYVLGPEDELSEVAEMTETASGANVVLYAPPDEGVYYMPPALKEKLGLGESEPAPPVCPVQLYLDMTAAGGRYADQAERLRTEVIEFE
jgi:DNA-binding transcriptional ArsR family regulator